MKAVLALAWLLGASVAPRAAADEPQTVLVAGATGSIGKFVVQDLLARGHRVRGLTRRPDAARADLPAGDLPTVDWVGGDLRERATLVPAVCGVDAIVFAAGSRSWEDPTNTPEKVDYGGVAALADLAAEHGVRHFVLISSAGVTRELSDASDHLRNVLKWKGKAEEHLRASGVAYTILRPLGMWDEPGGRLGIAMVQGDTIRSRVTISRADLAAVAAECAFNPGARNKTFELFNAAAFDVHAWRQDLAQLAADLEEK